jgi:hypothetical protein
MINPGLRAGLTNLAVSVLNLPAGVYKSTAATPFSLTVFCICNVAALSVPESKYFPSALLGCPLTRIRTLPFTSILLKSL